MLPAVVYGHGIHAVPVSVERASFEQVFAKAGETALIELTVDGTSPRTVLIHDVQRDILTDKVHHIDFYEVKMTEKVRTKVPLRFTGAAPAVKTLGGILVTHMTEVEVECLPADLPREIEVSLEGLAELNSVLRFGSIILPPNVKVFGHAEDPVATITPPRSEAELASLAETPPAEQEVASQVEVEHGGKETAEEAESAQEKQ
jgi:large subunit ribosomal protein L25